MRLPLLTLVLGLFVGLFGHALITNWTSSFVTVMLEPKPAVTKSPAQTAPVAAQPPRHMPVEKVLRSLRASYEEAVVVVLVKESYDDRHHLVRHTALEVWKGPTSLKGKDMDYSLGPPMSYLHSNTSETGLMFLPLTPHVDTGRVVLFSGDKLRMNPALTISELKGALVEGKEPKLLTEQSSVPQPALAQR